MIARVTGTLVEASPLMVVVDAGGVGYEVHIPVTTAETLPANGTTVTLFTHAVYREDGQSLYGFARRDERDFFRLLVDKVSGVGPKIAIAILSRMSIEILRGAIASSDVSTLAQCPGIGRKTAERLVIELKDKLFAAEPAAASAGTAPPGESAPAGGAAPGSTAYQDAFASLVTLGYKSADADKMLRRAKSRAGEHATTEELVRHALA